MKNIPPQNAQPWRWMIGSSRQSGLRCFCVPKTLNSIRRRVGAAGLTAAKSRRFVV
jgi:hypothetical protein